MDATIEASSADAPVPVKNESADAPVLVKHESTDGHPQDPSATTSALSTAKVPTKPLVKVKVVPEQVPGEGQVTILDHPAKPLRPIYKTCGTCRTYNVIPYVSAVHPNAIYSVAATPCNKWVLTGSEDGYIRKWNFYDSMNGALPLTQSQRHMQVDTVTKAGVIASYWDNDNTPDPRSLSPVYSLDVQSEAMFAVSGQSKYIALWGLRFDEGRKIHVFKEHTFPVSALKISPDEYGMVSGSWDKRVLYWDLNTGQVAREFKGHVSQISGVSFRPTPRQPTTGNTEGEKGASAPSQPILMTTSIDGQCKFWDLRDPTQLPQSFNPQGKNPPWCLASAWSPDGSKVYIGRRNATVEEWDFSMGQFIRTLKLPNNSGPVTSLTCTVNGKQIVVGSQDNLRMWDLETSTDDDKSVGVPFQVIPGHHGVAISSVIIDQSGRFMISASGNRGWDGINSNFCYFYEMVPLNEPIQQPIL
ncbi:WD40-repeat-containing domain protein [Dimargaris cristalligena]|uniref:WD40-repeat-containing domain protein n=1 Tax=Dimargaris cristalligena TaxID=215637 RepID=A0A4P9ZVU3_9FUNG|nr:WD40-repeat-containing domain protein [Dimargaris cristalligena]|eukprot:RKP37735.1 WD40-repeat-containing domain protein [Dimargaris cristalligena]